MKLKMLLLGLPFLLLPSLASAEVMSVKSETANFREKPTEAAKIKFSADKYFPVEVLEKKNGWAKVKDFEGDEAWVAQRLLASTPAVVILPEHANIREAANTSSDVLFKVARGEVFKVEERKGNWLRVVDGRGDGGWIREDLTWGNGEEASANEDKPAGNEKPSQDSDKSGDDSLESKAKPLIKEVQATAAQAASELVTPENLGSLCRAYLDESPIPVVPGTVKSTASHEVPKAVEKLEKIATAAKPEKAKPKVEKADKKKNEKADTKKNDKKKVKADTKKSDKKSSDKKADKKSDKKADKKTKH